MSPTSFVKGVKISRVWATAHSFDSALGLSGHLWVGHFQTRSCLSRSSLVCHPGPI